MSESMLARHPLWFKITAYGILLYFITLALIFLGFLAVPQPGTSEADSARLYTLALAIAAVPLAIVAYLIAHVVCRPATTGSAIALGIGWAAIQALCNLGIALLNGNVDMVFSSPSTYLVYLAVFVGAFASRVHLRKPA